MTFNSGFTCDICGESWEMSGMTAAECHSITHLRRHARGKGWSVGKDKLLCNKCRKTKKPTPAATDVDNVKN